MIKLNKIFIIIFFFLWSSSSQCLHDEISLKTHKHYLNDLANVRFLQSSQKNKIRIFVDYSNLKVGGQTEKNLIKRIMTIASRYFHNFLQVDQLSHLFFPNQQRKCNELEVPQQYIINGTIGDLGIICGNEKTVETVFVAKSASCSFLESSKRPIWGMISWNNPYLKYDQEGFQQMVHAGLHEIVHILGFSHDMYEFFPAGNPLVFDEETQQYYLNSQKIQQAIINHFGCNNSKGLQLQDQDLTIIASHWEQKLLGNELMIASNRKGSFMSKFTLALLASTGWYQVNETYAQDSFWGKGKGCQFLQIDNCGFQQFCQDSSFHCDWDVTAVGRCKKSTFSGVCKVVNYFVNTICIDQHFQLKNVNSNLNALERGGSNSRCFRSDYREIGGISLHYSNRCYISVCSVSGKFIYILVGSYVLVCHEESQVIVAPPGLEGHLICPSSFDRQCSNKKTCPYHCNKNGICINGKCLCADSLELSSSCLDVTIFDLPKFNFAASHKIGQVFLTQEGELASTMARVEPLPTVQNKLKIYQIDRKCIQGTTFDEIFGECVRCGDVFGCENCDEDGCVSCDDGGEGIDGRCR